MIPEISSKLFFPNPNLGFETLRVPRFFSFSCEADVPEKLVKELIEVGMSLRYLPPQNPGIGRSITAQIMDSELIEYTEAVKQKGGIGVKRIGNRFVLVDSMPLTELADGKQPHFKMASDTLEPAIVYSKTKGLFSIPFSNSKMEATAANRAKAIGLSEGAIGYGKLSYISGEAVLDINGEETGIVFLRAKLGQKDIGQFITFVALDTADINSSLHCFTMSPDGLNAEKKFDNAASIFLNATKLMGETKRRFIIEAHLGRHAGHTGNYNGEPESKSLQISDLDTVIDLESLSSAREWGAQLLRDVSSDMYRICYSFMEHAWSKRFLIKLANNTANPFQNYLEGFFKELGVSPELIQSKSKELNNKLLSELIEDPNFMDEFWKRRSTAYLSNDMKGINRAKLAAGTFCTKLIPDLLEASYQLIKAAQLPKNFELVDLPENIRKQRFAKAGMLMHAGKKASLNALDSII